MARFIVPTSASVIRASGSDVATYLQGQCTADVSKNNKDHALWLNRKGRVLAHTLIIKESDQSFLILCPHLQASDVISIMSSNLIADDVTFTDETSQWKTAIIWGDEAHSFDDSVRFWPSARTSFESWQILFPKDLKISGNESDLNTLEKNRIKSGIPSVPDDCGINEFPQECGLDDWVSYHKGCYLGQEVMARIHSMGTLRRSLRTVHAAQALHKGLELKSMEGNIMGVVKSCSDNIGLALVAAGVPKGAILLSDVDMIAVGDLAQLPKYS